MVSTFARSQESGPFLQGWNTAQLIRSSRTRNQRLISPLRLRGHRLCPRRRGHRARTQQRQSGGLRHPPRRPFRQRVRSTLTRSHPDEISRQDSAALAAFAREVGPLTFQTIATGDDISEHPGLQPAGSPPAGQSTGARHLLRLIGQAFGRRVLLMRPRATAKWSAAPKPASPNLSNSSRSKPSRTIPMHSPTAKPATSSLLPPLTAQELHSLRQDNRQAGQRLREIAAMTPAQQAELKKRLHQATPAA